MIGNQGSLLLTLLGFCPHKKDEPFPLHSRGRSRSYWSSVVLIVVLIVVMAAAIILDIPIVIVLGKRRKGWRHVCCVRDVYWLAGKLVKSAGK